MYTLNARIVNKPFIIIFWPGETSCHASLWQAALCAVKSTLRTAWTVTCSPVLPFKADEALVGLKRQLRDLRPLAERGHRFELRGASVIELAANGDQIDARVAQRPVSHPQWTTQALKSSADVRRFLDDMRRQLRRWESDE